MEIIKLIALSALLILNIVILITINKNNNSDDNNGKSEELDIRLDEIESKVAELKSLCAKQEYMLTAFSQNTATQLDTQEKRLQDVLSRGLKAVVEQGTNNQNVLLGRVDDKFKSIAEATGNTNKVIWERLTEMDKRLELELAGQNEFMQKSFALQRHENREQIDKIRESVNEKLDKTLNEQFDRSFKGIIEQMTQLQTSMGELKGISSQVGSLEKTLNGVKTRGILGETQLKMLIADILNPSQYDVEVATHPGTDDHVEIAIKLPDKNSDGFYYLPVDSKFHIDRYLELTDAYDTGDKDLIASARKNFRDVIKKDAKTIHDKYIKEPYTTPYAILFVPSEGIYSEIVSLNLLEELNSLHITVAGPYTMMAILSTVINYWQALAIEKKSNDIEKTLSGTKKAVKTFDDLLTKVRKNVNTVSNDLEKLQTTRTNVIMKALKNVSELASGESDDEIVLGLPDGEDED